MVTWLPREAIKDCFKPPDEPCMVRCLHCGQEYSSSQIVWRVTDGKGFWCCPIDGCGGIGFNFDIFPLDSPLWDDEDDDEDFDDEAEELAEEDDC